jgi:hypothetical protein
VRGLRRRSSRSSGSGSRGRRRLPLALQTPLLLFSRLIRRLRRRRVHSSNSSSSSNRSSRAPKRRTLSRRVAPRRPVQIPQPPARRPVPARHGDAALGDGRPGGERARVARRAGVPRGGRCWGGGRVRWDGRRALVQGGRVDGRRRRGRGGGGGVRVRVLVLERGHDRGRRDRQPGLRVQRRAVRRDARQLRRVALAEAARVGPREVGRADGRGEHDLPGLVRVHGVLQGRARRCGRLGPLVRLGGRRRDGWERGDDRGCRLREEDEFLPVL